MTAKYSTNIKVIKADSKRLTIITTLSDVWRCRGLLYFMGLRDIKVRYKQTALGVFWAVLNPVLQMLVWSFFFGKIAKLPSDGISYFLITLSGTIFWNFFSEIVQSASNSLVSNANLITKVAFPRIILPLSVLPRVFIDFTISVLIFWVLIFFCGQGVSYRILLTPFILTIPALAALGVGFFMASLNVKYRDVGKILPYLLQLLFFLTPVAYLETSVPEAYRWTILINPIATAIQFNRWVAFGLMMHWQELILAVLLSSSVFFLGLIYFVATEKKFADIV